MARPRTGSLPRPHPASDAAISGSSRWPWSPELVAWIVFSLLVVCGVTIRALIRPTGWSVPNSDIANGMVLALRASQGHLALLFPGHNYGAALLAWFEAPLVAVFGLHLWIFWLADTIVVVASAFVLRTVASRFIPLVAAAVAGGALVCLPPPWLYFSGREMLFYTPAILLGLTACWMLLRWWERPIPLNSLLFGICVGLAIWCDPLVLTFLAAPVVVFVWRSIRAPRDLATAAVGALAGVMPWLSYFLIHPHAFVRANDRQSVGTTVREAIVHILPSSLWSGRPMENLGIAIYVAASVGVVVFAWRRQIALLCCAVSVVVWPLAAAAAHEPLVAGTYRYAFFVLPSLLVLAAYVLSLVRLSVLGVAVALALVLPNVSNATHGFRTVSACTGQLTQLSDYLRSENRTAVWGSYWLAPVLTFCDYPHVVAASVTKVSDGPSLDAAANADPSTYVVYTGKGLDAQLLAWNRSHQQARRVPLGAFTVWLFTDKMSPAELHLVDGAY